MEKELSKKNKGFTLVETLVAIAILTMSIAGTFTAVQGGLRASSYAKNQVVAFYLIQDAVEYIRNVRDGNALSNLANGTNNDWLTGLANCFKPSVCIIDTIYQTVTLTSSPSPLLLMDSGGRFGYSPNGMSTIFSRDITIEKVPNTNDEVIITVTILWPTDGAFAKGNITVKATLFNTR